MSKEELLRINREFLNHNYHTDIISFDYTKSKIIEADFYLSMWAIKNSAKKAKQTIENETLRVIITEFFTVWAIMTRPQNKQKLCVIKKKNLFHCST